MATTEASVASLFFSRDLSHPPPQEPLNRTPITPTKTVGAATYELFRSMRLHEPCPSKKVSHVPE
ncbi:MAG TPA: hypothetical protein VN280_20980 [Variovorax sp.]|nr:hypothetical protein [Variovorax sp.]